MLTGREAARIECEAAHGPGRFVPLLCLKELFLRHREGQKGRLSEFPRGHHTLFEARSEDENSSSGERNLVGITLKS